MASEIKYLSLEGLARVIANIKFNFGKRLSYSPNATNGTLYLLSDAIDESTATYGVLSTITIPSVSASEAGLMTPTQLTTLNNLAAEEITGITAGNGLTGGGTKGSITLNVGAGTGISVATDTVSIKTASTSEIGGIKIAAKRTTTPTITTGGTTTGRYYGVELDNNNKAFVHVPWVNTTTLTINATASDDDVVILTGTSGSNGVSYGVSHAKMFDATTPTTTNKYTSGNTTTSISGSGGSGIIKIPQLTVDEYGHVKAASDEEVTISIPTIPTTLKSPKALSITVGNNAAVSYDGGTAKSVVITPETIGIPNVMQYAGQTATTQTLADGSATQTITLTTGSYTAKRGDVVIDSSNSREYIWDGSKWELFGVDDISSYKLKQTAVTSPTANSTAIAFIDTISQDAQGVITATKKTVQNATTGQAGVVKIGSNINVSSGTISVPTAAANALGVVKGWHRTSGTATGTRVTNATNSPSVNVRTTNGDRYYGVETDKNGAMFVNVPWVNTTTFTINATANDDDVVILTGTSGSNGVTYTASHTKQGPTGGFAGISTATAQSPAHSNAATLNIPLIDVNEYGHVTTISNQEVKITLPAHTNHTIQKGTATNCTITVTNSGSTSTIGVAVPTAAANALGVVKGWHRTSGTATGTRTTNATNAPSINARTTSNGRYYGVETDSTGAMFVNVPWENNTHHQAKNIVASGSTVTSSPTQSINNPYLNLVENNTARSGIQIVGAGGTTVSGENGKITITSETHVAITNDEIDALFGITA